MKDFEVKIWIHKGKQVSELLEVDSKYFKWLYHKMWERAHTEEYCFCMEELWTKSWRILEKLTKKVQAFINPIDSKKEYETVRAFHHLWDHTGPWFVRLSEVTEKMINDEDDFVAQNYEFIITQK